MDSLLERVRVALQDAASGMSPEQLAWHADEKWCAAQILEHLSLTFAATTKGMQRALAGGTTSRPRTVKDRVSTLVVVGLGYMPPGRPAPTGVVPGEGDPVNGVATILANLAAMDAVLTEVERTKGSKLRLQHPILGPLTIPQWRKFHCVHTAHHVKQIERLKRMQQKP